MQLPHQDEISGEIVRCSALHKITTSDLLHHETREVALLVMCSTLHKVTTSDHLHCETREVALLEAPLV
jgi:hypothetical protein